MKGKTINECITNLELSGCYTKKEIKRLRYLITRLNLKSKAQFIVLEHLFFRDKTRSILVHDYGTLIENETSLGKHILVDCKTNKHCLYFTVFSYTLENNDTRDLWHKID